MFLGISFRFDCASGVENFVDHSEANVYLTSVMKKATDVYLLCGIFLVRNVYTINILSEHNNNRENV